MKDAHDPREFRRWLSFTPEGTVAAVHEFEASREQPLPDVIETQVVADFTTVQIDPALLTDRDAKIRDHAAKAGAASSARVAADLATVAVQQAVEAAVQQATAAVAAKGIG